MDPSQASHLQAFVNRLAMRSELTQDEINALLALTGHYKKLAARVDIVRLGELVDHACLVVTGLVGRFGQNSEGDRQITGLYIPGDMADLPSVVSPKSGWGLTSLTSTTILRVPHPELRHIAARHPGVAEALWRDCVADGSTFSEWVVNVGRRDALTRIAHLFCEMAVRSERAGHGSRQSFPLPITQTDLGDATGLTSVHVNRTLQKMRELSLVTVSRGGVCVPDWDRLVEAGEFDDGFLLLDGPAPRIMEAA